MNKNELFKQLDVTRTLLSDSWHSELLLEHKNGKLIKDQLYAALDRMEAINALLLDDEIEENI